MQFNQKIMNSLKKILPFCLLVLAFTACKKTNYYKDSGVHNPHFSGTVMQYLESKPEYFTKVVEVIKLAGMEDVFEKQDITFFAPSDSCISMSVNFLNEVLLMQGRDTIQELNQINPDVWKSELSMYVFKGKRLLNDYPQLDLDAIPVFPGQTYESYGGRSMNIGVIYNNAGGVQYAGYRQLVISYIPSLAAPRDGWITAVVASSDVQPDNGVVHVLRFSDHFFGFDVGSFIQKAMDGGISKP